jgi:hypothetical protein
VVIVVLLIFVLSIWVITGKLNIFDYIDIPTLTFVGLLPYCIMWVLFGNSKTKRIISVPFTKNQTDDILNESLLFFKMFNKIMWCSALLVMIINLIDIVLSSGGYKSSELDYIVHLALTLISPLYAFLINLIFILPYTILIKNKITNSPYAKP